MRNLIVALAACALTVAPASAQVFSDNFDGENGGVTALNYGGLANFTVPSPGTIDLLRHNDPFMIRCAGGTGSCIDLDGSNNHSGFIVSRQSFAFNAGDFVRLSFDLSGNQRSGVDDFNAGFNFSTPTQLIDYGLNFFGSDLIIGSFTNSSPNSGGSVADGEDFFTRSIFFTAGNAGSLTFRIGTFGDDNVGPILDNVALSIGPAGAVPEPATWMMMILGFGFIGWSMRRHKAAALRIAAA
jgi:PEP-CTERM motif